MPQHALCGAGWGQVLTAAQGVIDLKTAGVEGATLGLEALSIAPRPAEGSDAAAGASTAAVAAVAGPPPADGGEPADSEAGTGSGRDAGQQQQQQHQSIPPAQLAPPIPAARVKGSAAGGSGAVWLSNAAPTGPLPSRPERKEALDEQQQMAACG